MRIYNTITIPALLFGRDSKINAAEIKPQRETETRINKIKHKNGNYTGTDTYRL